MICIEDEWLSANDISKRLGVHPSTIPHLVKKHDIPKQQEGYHDIRYPLSLIVTALQCSQTTNQHNKRFIDPSETKIYDDFWRLNWDEFILGCDTHSPHYSERILNKMLNVAQKYKIPNFAHAGDFFNGDTFSYHWVAKEDLVSWPEEIQESKKIVNLLTDNFDDTRFFLGSHDTRLWRMLYSQGKATDYHDVWDLLENKKIKVSPYRYCEIGDDWRVNHPKNIVKVGGLPAIRMTAKFNRSIIFGHGHWQGWVFAPDGKHILVAPGCLCDPQKISYKNLWDTSYDEWVPGFVMVRDKIRVTICNEYSDWDLILGNRQTP